MKPIRKPNIDANRADGSAQEGFLKCFQDEL